MEPQQHEEEEKVPHCVKKTVKRKWKTVDYSNVVLALPAMNVDTTAGGPSSHATEPNVVSNEQYIPEEDAGTVQLQNLANAEDILEVDLTVQQSIDINNKHPIIEEQAVVENQQDVVVNWQHLPDEQAGIMQEQNIRNVIEENVPEDPAVFADIFSFSLSNELVDLGTSEDILDDPTGAENEQNIINNQQHISDQQAGIVQPQNPAQNAIEEVVAEDDPTVFGDIFDFPLNNQLMDLD